MRRAPIFLALLVLPASFMLGQGSWVHQTSSTLNHLRGVDFIDAATGWVVGDSGTLLKTTNGGGSWVPQSTGDNQPLDGVDFINGSTGWVIGGDTYGFILKTTNGGASWARQDSGGMLEAIQMLSATIGYAVGFNGLILKTTNGGAAWVDKSDPSVHSCLETLSFADSATGWTAGLIPGIVMKTTNGGTSWISQTNGIDGADDYHAIFFADHQSGWAAGYGILDTNNVGVIRHTTNGGATWTDQSTSNDQVLLSAFFRNPSEGWVVGGAGLILHTTTSGASWETESSGGAGELDHIVVVDTLGGWIAGFGGVILHNDFGPGVLTDTLSLSTGWNILSLPLSVADNQKSSLFPDAVSRAFLYDNGSGYRSTDTLTPGRGYWVKFSAAEQVPVTGQSIDALTVNLTAGWNLVGGISSDVPVNSIVQNPPGSVSSPPFGYSGTYYVATTIQHGVGYWIRTSQACQLTFQSGFHSAVARKYQIDVNSLRADELPPPPPGGFPPPASAAQLPGRFMLEQNYPNPFNPSTELSFDVRDVSRVTLRIYDLLGREVATLVDGVREPGRYSAAWDASRMPGGIYFAKMTAAGGEQYEATRKLVLLR